MHFELCDHTADLGIRGHGDSFGEAAAAVAEGMAHAMAEEIPERGERFSLTARGESREAVLFEYLDELILQRDLRGVLPVANKARLESTNGDFVIAASARGIPLEGLHAREIKAITYSEMSIEQTDTGWSVYVVVDV